MIQIIVDRTNKWASVEGHAIETHTEKGNNVCAAISALTCNLVNSIKALSDSEPNMKLDSGYFIIYYDNLDDAGRVLFDSWLIGMETISETYGNVNIVEHEFNMR